MQAKRVGMPDVSPEERRRRIAEAERQKQIKKAVFNPTNIEETLNWCENEAKTLGWGSGNLLRDQENEGILNKKLGNFKGRNISWSVFIGRVGSDRIYLSTPDFKDVHIFLLATPTSYSSLPYVWKLGVEKDLYDENDFYLPDDEWKQFAKKLNQNDELTISGTIERASYIWSRDSKHGFKFTLVDCAAK